MPDDGFMLWDDPGSNQGGQHAAVLPPVQIADKALFLLTKKARFKVLYGGRGGAKSWSMAIALAIHAHQAPRTRPELMLCTREYQNSIDDSVYRVIVNAIDRLNLRQYFEVQAKTIKHRVNGSQFIFKGLRHDPQGIKSTEGVTKVWVEEAQAVSEDSWQILGPTIRAKGGEIWVSFNPLLLKDPTSQRFLVPEKVDPRAIVVKIGWQDNPWFPPDLEEDRLWMQRSDPDAYEHIWNGQFLALAQSAIFRGSYVVEPFETPQHVDRFHFGADFGFANDPSTLIRSFIVDNTLYIDYEAWALHVEIDELPIFYEGGQSPKTGRMFPGIDGAKKWPIKADNARPETISYLHREGFNIMPAEKWPGCIEDGISHIKGFKKVVIHPRCERTAEEARLYSFKVDKKTNEVLPVIIDRHNHCWDAVRYSLDGYIQRRGAMGVWAKLAGLKR